MKAAVCRAFGAPLTIEEVELAAPRAGEIRVKLAACAICHSDIIYADGGWGGTLPAVYGHEAAGVVEEVGAGVESVAAGHSVIGWSERRSSHAEFVAVPAEQLTAKPDGLAWEVAGSLFVAGMAAYAGVQAVAPAPGEVVVVSGAAGGVGSIAVQLAVRSGATVIGLASEGNHAWLRDHGVIAVTYGDGQAERIGAASGGHIDAFIDTFGGGYVDLAVSLGVPVERINTIADFEAIERLGVHGEGTHAVGTSELLAQLAALAADGSVEVPIARTFPLVQVRDAFDELALRKTHGKIVLIP